MTLQTLRGMRAAAPFQPFAVPLTSGRTLNVARPDHPFFIPDSRKFAGWRLPLEALLQFDAAQLPAALSVLA